MGAQIFPVTERVWCLRRGSYLTCSYLVKAEAGIVLVDAGMDSTGEDLRRALREAFGAELRDVAAVILTHWHNDHAAGARVVQLHSNARVHYHAGDEPQLDGTTAAVGARGWLAAQIPERGPLVLFKGLLGEATPSPIRRDQRVREGDRVLSDFEILETPGHTPGHLSVLYGPEQVLFAGDALAVVGERIRFMARPVTPDLPRARAAMRHCLSREFERLCPGHRTPLTRGVREERLRMLAALDAGLRWPWFG